MLKFNNRNLATRNSASVIVHQQQNHSNRTSQVNENHVPFKTIKNRSNSVTYSKRFAFVVATSMIKKVDWCLVTNTVKNKYS